MEPFQTLGTLSLYGLMVGILATAAITVSVRNLFHAAIALAFTLIGIAIVYFFLHADFIAAIQILLYVGAIMVLVIFAIMLTARIQDPNVSQSNRQRIPTFILTIGLAAFLVTAILKTPWKLAASPQATNAIELGQALMNDFVLPFEVMGFVLLVALIGAIVVARGDQ